MNAESDKLDFILNEDTDEVMNLLGIMVAEAERDAEARRLGLVQKISLTKCEPPPPSMPQKAVKRVSEDPGINQSNPKRAMHSPVILLDTCGNFS